ncbi:MAG: hypothetical protein R3F59_25785 [Myxococcota bacterium]
MPVEHFEDDDQSYLAWLDAHPDGFVIDRDRTGTTDWYLHRASCAQVHDRSDPRRLWTHERLKDCAPGADPLVAWAMRAGAELLHCGQCRP